MHCTAITEASRLQDRDLYILLRCQENDGPHYNPHWRPSSQRLEPDSMSTMIKRFRCMASCHLDALHHELESGASS